MVPRYEVLHGNDLGNWEIAWGNMMMTICRQSWCLLWLVTGTLCKAAEGYVKDPRYEKDSFVSYLWPRPRTAGKRAARRVLCHQNPRRGHQLQCAIFMAIISN